MMLSRLHVSPKFRSCQLAEFIRWYIDTFETISRWQRSKQTRLEFLERQPLGKSVAHTLTSADLIRHVRAELLTEPVANELLSENQNFPVKWEIGAVVQVYPHATRNWRIGLMRRETAHRAHQ